MPMIQVTMVGGRTPEQKHQLIESVSAAVSQALGVPIDRVRIAIYEISADEWGIGGVPYAMARPTEPAPAAGNPANTAVREENS